MNHRRISGRYSMPLLLGALTLAPLAIPDSARAQCNNTITADVVALDQMFFWNRLGAMQPQGMMFALRRDVVPVTGGSLTPGNVQLRPDKRPRPIVLRMNVGDCLAVSFENLLNPSPVDDEQPATRTASVHVIGMQLAGSIADDGSNVGENESSIVAPGDSATYTFYAEREGTHVLYSAAVTTGGEGDGGSLNAGLFGAVNVEPAGAEWYRSQVTADDLALATTATTADGHPIIDYNAVYPAGHAYEGLPILKMLNGNAIVHSDLTAIITGPGAGRFPGGTFTSNPTEPDREQPFREFTINYHDEIGAVEAFPGFFEDAVLGHTLHSVRDAFAINYGTGGIGSEILANRFEVGPMHACTECKYEEFFLSSWTVGDPAMVVDVPANAGLEGLTPGQVPNPADVGPKATKALYPDDPSNVYHSYMRDHTKFRILHGGSKEHHIHHQHAHQWLHTPDSDNSAYLDSQMIGPGASFTLEMTYNGSGNRNQTVGDSIFHCHLYPHFAQGMWSMWRVHDVFEAGTELEIDPADGLPRPTATARALPDGEIAVGTPIPAVVPLPTLAMAPLPQADVTIVAGEVVVAGTGNPGYPFFIPGVAGHRPPHPPLDTIDDGGLPRHVIVSDPANDAHSVETRLDFSKDLIQVAAKELLETGEPVEVAAMVFHETRQHPSYTPDGTPGNFIANGLPRQPGAPYAEPCIDDAGMAVGVPRLYQAADIQVDAIFNKAGWHFPQHRMLSLWQDVAAFQGGSKAPEPFFFRANTNDCIEYQLTNLVPNVYELDDFQVRTPTDVLGQHIHLVKFDVTSSDGAGNGWNYEDGSFSPDEVIERIEAINEAGGLIPAGGGDPVELEAESHPYFGVLGAQTTVQRWFADDVLNNSGEDRTLRTVFTHDHFGPSTHQQAGLYAGLVIEPEGSTWRHPETGETFGTRADGGPTSWRADILTTNPDDSYREFLLEFADFQLAYYPNAGFPDPANAINPPGKVEVGLPFLLERPNVCPGGVPPPCPEAVSADDPGTMSVNYRNEPIALRVRDPQNNTQAAGDAGDLSMVFRSDIQRADSALNGQPSFYPPLTGGVQPGDPYTPLLRAYENDKVQIRWLVGAHEEGHNSSMHGVKWLYEPSDPNSGYRNSQQSGLSEHFEFVLPAASAVKGDLEFADYLYMPGAAVDDLWNGLWGIMRTYNGGVGLQSDLLPLPNNPNGKAPPVTGGGGPPALTGPCKHGAPSANFKVFAVAAQDVLLDGELVYNSRTQNNGPLNDPTAILYVLDKDIDKKTGKLKAGVPIEPLVLRANAGDCINITLENHLPAVLPDLDGFNTLPMIVDNFNANQIRPSSRVGLHAQLVNYNMIKKGDGAEVGFNATIQDPTIDPQVAGPGETVKYQWYAGDVRVDANDNWVATPVEFGAINLMPADRIKHSNKGAIGALIIEPEGSTWEVDADDPMCGESDQPRCSRASATVTPLSESAFREFVVLFQNDLNLRKGDGSPVELLADTEDPEDSGQKAINYRTEPFWFRLGFAPDSPLEATRARTDMDTVVSNDAVGGDPETPVFEADAGTPVRFRVLHPGGHPRNNVFQIHGHIWEQMPYINGSTEMGHNPYSEWKGAQMGHGPSNHFDAILKNGAGGKYEVAGDYLWRDMQSFTFDGGMWGILRVK